MCLEKNQFLRLSVQVQSLAILGLDKLDEHEKYLKGYISLLQYVRFLPTYRHHHT